MEKRDKILFPVNKKLMFSQTIRHEKFTQGIAMGNPKFPNGAHGEICLAFHIAFVSVQYCF